MLSRMRDSLSPVEATGAIGPRGRVLGWGLLLAFVAVAILAIAAIEHRPASSGIVHLEVVFLDAGRAGGAGSPYVIDLELEHDGYPVIVHVDVDGLPSLLFPLGPPLRVGAGRIVRLPEPSGSATWWIPTGEPGGTLLVAIESRTPQSTERLLDLAERAAARASDSVTARESVRRVMRDRLGPTIVAELGTRD